MWAHETYESTCKLRLCILVLTLLLITMILISAISVLARKTLSAWDLESNMGQILASSIVTWIIFKILICFYNERWLAWTSGYYCAQKMNNVFYKWALYYCYYCHHSSILISRRASSLVLNMIGYDCFLMIFIHLLNYTHGSLTCFSASHWEGKRNKIHAASWPHS